MTEALFLVLGAVLAFVAQQINFRQTGRRETLSWQRQTDETHAKWTREERLKVYSRFLANADAWMFAVLKGRRHELDAMRGEQSAAIATLQLVGPDDVYDAAVAYTDSVEKYLAGRSDAQDTTRQDVRRAFIAEVRKVVNF